MSGLFRRRFNDGMIPLPFIKAYIDSHSSCGYRLPSYGMQDSTYRYVVLCWLIHGHDAKLTTCHVDLKLENIMVSFEDPAVMGDFMNDHFDQPTEYKIDSIGRPVYRRHNNFGPLTQLRNIVPKIIGFGHCASLDSDDDWGIYHIQQDTMTA